MHDDDLVIDLDAPAPGSDRSAHWRQIYRPPYPEELHSTAFVAERTVAFIEAAEAAERPWLAWCSFPDPHHPMTPPGKWFDRYRSADMPLPETRHDPLDGAPAHLRHFAGVHPRDQRNWVSPCGFGEDDLLREAIAATYGMIGWSTTPSAGCSSGSTNSASGTTRSSCSRRTTAT